MSLIVWAISAEGAPIVGAISLALTSIGLPIAVVGLGLTYLQAKRATEAAANAKEAVDAFKVRVDRYSAYRDVGEATLAVDNTRKHIINKDWEGACDSYEVAFRAITRVRKSSADFSSSLTGELERMASHMRRFCDKVDAARAGKGDYPDATKVLSAIRLNHEILTEASVSLENEAHANE